MAVNPYSKTLATDNVTRVVASHHNAQENQIEALTNQALAVEGMLVDGLNFGSVAASVAAERAVFVAPSDCRVYGLMLVNALPVAANGVSYTKLELINKGSSGIGTTVLATFDGSTTAFVAFDAVLPSFSVTDLSDGDVLTLKKTDFGAGASVTDLLVKILYKPIS